MKSYPLIWGLFHKSLQGSLLNNQNSMQSKAFFFRESKSKDFFFEWSLNRKDGIVFVLGLSHQQLFRGCHLEWSTWLPVIIHYPEDTWYICLHELLMFIVLLIGKYTIPMDPSHGLGIVGEKLPLPVTQKSPWLWVLPEGPLISRDPQLHF